MIAVTSLGFNRIERQQYCVATWKAMGMRVIAVQNPGESDRLKSDFPTVCFKEYELPLANLFSKNTPTIQSMTNQAIEENETVLIINSDISIKDKPSAFSSHWEVIPKTLSVGIRWNAAHGSKRRTREPWGIDVFMITKEMAEQVPDIGFRIGLPGWDFWITYHLHTLGYGVHVTGSKLFHENHPRGWNRDDQNAYRRMVAKQYNCTERMLPYFIKDITKR
jgi:hypothetical protein